MWYRKCPVCNSEVSYSNKRCWYNANRHAAKCIECQNKQLSEIFTGRKNPNYPINSSEPYKYVSVVLEHNRREMRKIYNASYEEIENVHFLNESVEDLCLKLS